MATVQIELWHLVTLSVTVLGGFWALAKVIASQFQAHLDGRFTAQDESRKANHAQLATRLDSLEQINREEAAQWQRLERDLLRMQADMPIHYVRREDYIRGQSVIEAKLDGLATKIENAQLRAAAAQGAPR